MESTKEKLLHLAELLQQQLVAVFFLLILWEVFKNYTLSSVGTWHIVLCVFGYGVCFVEAILMFTKEGFLRDADRFTRSKYHALWAILGCVSVTVGVALKIYQKNESNRDHFTSTHGRLGLCAWILTVLVALVGPIVTYSKKFSHKIRPIWIKGCHIFLGIAAYVLGIVTLGFGLDYLSAYTGEHGRIALLVFLIVYVSYSLVRPVLTLFNLFSS
ncbi:hypothetical protein NQ318_001319 [Aromia moschata]|uniref:ascorbate ferrireductase (transmembrane) n=1 Tax=Aromia moschata TaxID=1265417 RepID=A0AAV8ZGQ8_9CUCU|nr:hypothetical protein NQ318_001319 [Aromia moschata]